MIAKSNKNVASDVLELDFLADINMLRYYDIAQSVWMILSNKM